LAFSRTVFVITAKTNELMKGATLLLTLIVLCTFPIWIGLIAGGFGIVIGLFAGIFGLIAGIFGAIIGIIAWVFESIFSGIFGWGHNWNFFSFPHFHINGFGVAAIIIVIALLANRKKSAKGENNK